MTDGKPADLTVIVVNYNTRELTLKCLETLYAETTETSFDTILVDNASADGSADAIAQAFPQVRLVRSEENLGFAAANNLAAKMAKTEWLLLLNSDTEVLDGAVDRLMRFARKKPGHGIYGGRTLFADRSLNPTSCWSRITPWSLFCSAAGLTALMPKSGLFNPEGFGGWDRSDEREVDIVVGCFLLIPRALWEELGGFDLKYFMYGEEADLCLRSKRLGYRPVVTPEATIIHLGGMSNSNVAEKTALVAKARMTLIRDHWPAALVPLGTGLYWLWGAVRLVGATALSLAQKPSATARLATWRKVWSLRKDWLAGYGERGGARS